MYFLLGWTMNLVLCVYGLLVDQKNRKYRSSIYVVFFEICNVVIPTKIMRTISKSILKSQS